MLRWLCLSVPLVSLACSDEVVGAEPGDSTTSVGTVTTGAPSATHPGQGELWADGTYDGQPFSVRCTGDQIVGTRGVGDPTPTTLSCTDRDAGFNVLLVALGPAETTYTDCGTEQALTFTPTDGDGQLSCLVGGYASFELAVVDFVETDDGGAWWAGDFSLVMDDGAHAIDVVGGFDAASPAF